MEKEEFFFFFLQWFLSCLAKKEPIYLQSNYQSSCMELRGLVPALYVCWVNGDHLNNLLIAF